MKEISTDNWEILGADRIRRWPSQIGEKRPLKVNIDSWVGLSLGAKHVNVRVEEAENMWWSELENAWVRIYTDTESTGYEMKAKLLHESEAIKMAKAFILLVAGKDRANHIVRWNGPGRPKWAE